MPDYDKAMAVVDAYIKRLSDGDVAAVVALYAEDASVEDPVGSEPRSGAASLSEFYQQAADMNVVLTRTGPGRLAGNEIAFPFQVVIDAPDSNLTIEIIDVFTLNEACKITRMRAFWGADNMRNTAISEQKTPKE